MNTVRVTNVRIDLSRYPGISPLQRMLYAIKSKRSIDPAEMAETYTWLANSPEVAGMTGKHVDERRRVLPYRRYELDAAVREELNRHSLLSVGLASDAG